MKKIFKSKIFWLIFFDITFIPFCLFCKWLSDEMLSHSTVCLWTALGGKCITCGGTHFVNSLLSGNIIDAFHHNQLLFFAAIILVITFIMLHLYWLWNIKLAKKVLSIIYSIPSLIITVCAIVLFLILRNIPIFMFFFKIIDQLINNS